MKALSEEALVYTDALLPNLRNDSPGTAEMAADFLAAIRWYRVAVDPTETDQTLLGDGIGRTRLETILDAYRHLPPSADRDQAMKILSYYLPMHDIPGRDQAPNVAMIVAMKVWQVAQMKLPPKQRVPWNDAFSVDFEGQS
jgi:hypothetical protein